MDQNPNNSSQNNFNPQSDSTPPMSQPPVASPQPTPSSTPNKTLLIVLLIVGGFIFGVIILGVIIFVIVSAIITNVANNSNQLVCESSRANITLLYNDSELIGYITNNMNYDLSDEKSEAKSIGLDNYLQDFSDWFSGYYDGTCTANGKELSTQDPVEDKPVDIETKIVGDDEHGYISVPDDWAKFYDVDGASALQYSYAGVYIVSLDYVDDAKHSAREYATNFSYTMEKSDEVTGVSFNTVAIGKNKEYTAYRVDMYYPSDKVYLVTYWFETEDGKVRYIALEGPNGSNDTNLDNFMFIPDSFSLTK